MNGEVAVVGASGFVGSAVVKALQRRGYGMVPVRAPRLPGMEPETAMSFVEAETALITELGRKLRSVIAVVNAAGNPDASSRGTAALISANGVLPGLIAAAAKEARVRRVVHVSSAVVQGRLPVLDETADYDPFSAYAHSKMLGERTVQRFSDGSAVVYRPPSVHSMDRRVTQMTARIAGSPAGSVASPPSAPSPQALIDNVADAIALLATTNYRPPGIVIHPWEGLTTGDVMTVLGGREPIVLPRALARLAIRVLEWTGWHIPSVAANARRLEMLWFGQRQAQSWLSAAGWAPPAQREAWVELGKSVRERPKTIAKRSSKK